MIVFIEGEVINSSSDGKVAFVDILTASGVGYRVVVAVRNLGKLGNVGERVQVHTYMQVREDSQNLFGFLDEDEKAMFERIISVSGIGPKIGMSVLNKYPVVELRDILLRGDVTALSKVSGLGAKGAKKIILDLQGVLAKEDEVSATGKQPGIVKELREALESLGFKGAELKGMIQRGEKLVETDSKDGENKYQTIESLLKDVLAGRG